MSTVIIHKATGTVMDNWRSSRVSPKRNVRRGPSQQKIWNAFLSRPGAELSRQRLAELTDMPRDVVRKACARLIDRGDLIMFADNNSKYMYKVNPNR